MRGFEPAFGLMKDAVRAAPGNRAALPWRGF
jgi:hypothetical protein